MIRYLNLFSEAGECNFSGHRLKFSEITPYIEANSREAVAQINTNHGKMMAKKEFELGTGEQATLAVVKRMRKPELVKITEHMLSKRSDRAYIRFVNLANREVSVQRVNGEVLCSLLPNECSEYNLAQEGGYVFELCTKDTKNVITCRIEKENKYSFYIIDSPSRSKPDFFVYHDD